MFKKTAIFLITACLSSAAFAQTIADINAPKILPPSPEAAALGKYAIIPVDKSVGVPSISVPLYTIKTPRFSLPISLSYHASGVKVDETAGWVGLGWSLNAGGMISRSIVGIADDAPSGFLNTATIPLASSLGPNFYHNIQGDSTFMQNVILGAQDSQPDNFFYNFADQSGQFVFGEDKSPVLTPYKPIKVTFVPNGGNGYFSVVDENGNTYLFQNKETSYSTTISNLTGTSSWYLTKMTSADQSDVINFYYSNDAAVFADNNYAFSQTVGRPQNNPGCCNILWPLESNISPSRTQQIHLDSIKFNGGKVDFIKKGGRLDNGNVALDSVIVSNYDWNAQKYKRLKSFKLLTDYFVSGSVNSGPYNINTDAPSLHRLKLTGLSENDQNNAAIKTHQFDYNTTVSLPPVHNFGQDIWGYYNGQSTNQTLLATQVVQGTFGGQIAYYTIGGANRDVSPANMQAGMLQKITYPTKGYTIFSYEPHQYLAPMVTTYKPAVSSVGVFRDTSMATFTPSQYTITQQSGQLIFHVHMTKNVNSSYSYVKVIRASDQQVMYYYPGSSTIDLDFDAYVTLAADVQYILMAVSIDNIDTTIVPNLPVSAISTIYQTSGAPVATNLGGLRVKSIKTYDSNSAIISTEAYKYGLNESGAGDFLTNSTLNTNKTEHLYQFDPTINQGASALGQVETYGSSSVYPLSSQNGSPVAYSQVTIYHGDTVQNIGKSVYKYTVSPDSIAIYNTPRISIPVLQYHDDNNKPVYWTSAMFEPGAIGIRPMTQSWKNGEPVTESHYRNIGGQYFLQQEKNTVYGVFYRAPARGLYIQSSLDFWDGEKTVSYFVTINDFIFYDYYISSGSRQPMQTITANYASDGVTKLTSDTVQYAYANPSHMFPTTITGYDGKGNTLLKTVKYPQDMVNASLDPTGIYASMVAANIISPVIQFTQSKNTTQLMQSVTNYASTAGIINPSTVNLQVMANAAETRLNYQDYDTKGNLATVLKQYGAPVSYVWGYNKSYPVAEVKNAPAKDIFYESFEDGNGNSGGAKTGRVSFVGAYTKTVTSLDNGAYRLTYWKKTGSAWALKDTTVTVSSGSYAINTTGQVDDIRFYPAAAQMTTYTYDPLIGVTSTTDAKGAIMYYEYDYLQRLQNIRDQYKNIVKSFCYNYAGQATGCYIDLPSFKNAPQNGAFTRNNCGAGYLGNVVIYTVPAGSYVSNISQQDADNQALAEVSANGQDYANANGICQQSIGFTFSNSTGATMQATFNGSATNYSFTITSGVVQIPVGTYNINIYPDSGNNYHHIQLGSRTPVYLPATGFTSVSLAPGSTDLSLTITN